MTDAKLAKLESLSREEKGKLFNTALNIVKRGAREDVASILLAKIKDELVKEGLPSDEDALGRVVYEGIMLNEVDGVAFVYVDDAEGEPKKYLLFWLRKESKFWDDVRSYTNLGV